jgi:hypothetical protein
MHSRRLPAVLRAAGKGDAKGTPRAEPTLDMARLPQRSDDPRIP